MNHEEKVLFLFAQTCTLLSGQLSKGGKDTSPISGAMIQVSPAKIATRGFDEVYSALEAKLDERLNPQD